MTNNFLTTIKSLKLIEGCKAAQFYAFSSVGAASTSGSGDAGAGSSSRPPPPPPPKSFSMRSGSLYYPHAAPSTSAAEAHLPCGLPVAEALEPRLDACLRPVDLVAALGALFRRVSAAAATRTRSATRTWSSTRCSLRRGTRGCCAPQRARRRPAQYERREDEFEPAPPPLAPCTVTTPLLECPRAAVFAGGVSASTGADAAVCPCHRPPPPPVTPPPHRLRRNASSSAAAGAGEEFLEEATEEAEAETNDLWFVIGEEVAACERSCIAALSKPLNTLLYGGFAEAQRDRIDFSRDGISARGCWLHPLRSWMPSTASTANISATASRRIDTSAPRSSTPWATTPTPCATARPRCAWTRRTATHSSCTARLPGRLNRRANSPRLLLLVVVDSAAIFARRDDETILFSPAREDKEAEALQRSVRQERQDVHKHTHMSYVYTVLDPVSWEAPQ